MFVPARAASAGALKGRTKGKSPVVHWCHGVMARLSVETTPLNQHTNGGVPNKFPVSYVRPQEENAANGVKPKDGSATDAESKKGRVRSLKPGAKPPRAPAGDAIAALQIEGPGEVSCAQGVTGALSSSRRLQAARLARAHPSGDQMSGYGTVGRGLEMFD